MSLREKLNYRNAARKYRMEAAQWVLAHPETFRELLEISLANEKDLSHKANWALEFVCLEQLTLLYPHLDLFFDKIASVEGDSSVRPISHIAELLALQYYKKKDAKLRELLSQKHKEQLTECCFDWLISQQKVACQVRAMTCLYYLGTEFDWIHPELKIILEQNMHKGSAGYCSRGKKTLELIQKRQKKQ